MLKLTCKTTKGKFKAVIPESWDETSVEQFQRIIKEWDGADVVKLFSILSGIEVNDIATSKDGRLETTLYQCIRFVYAPFNLEALPIPETLWLRPIWLKDQPLLVDHVVIPKKIGRLTIGQAIQARKLLEEAKDLREGISMVTAIYLQPLIDKSSFDMLRAIELEQVILKMPITKVFPIGFFFLKTLSGYGTKHESVWSRIKNFLQIRKGET